MKKVSLFFKRTDYFYHTVFGTHSQGLFAPVLMVLLACSFPSLLRSQQVSIPGKPDVDPCGYPDTTRPAYRLEALGWEQHFPNPFNPATGSITRKMLLIR